MRCHTGAQHREKKIGRDKRGRGALCSPESKVLAVGDGGTAERRTGGLVALWWCYLGQKKEEGEGYKRLAVARPFALGWVGIEEGRSTGRRASSLGGWGRS